MIVRRIGRFHCEIDRHVWRLGFVRIANFIVLMILCPRDFAFIAFWGLLSNCDFYFDYAWNWMDAESVAQVELWDIAPRVVNFLLRRLCFKFIGGWDSGLRIAIVDFNA